MVTLKNKKELNSFIKKMSEYIDYLINKLNERGFIGNYSDFEKNLDLIEEFYKTYFTSYSQEEQDVLQQAFWAFCAKMLMDKLGGELVLGDETDYGTGTPIYIKYGNKYNKKGKKQWMGITFDTWFETYTYGNHYFTLKNMVENIIKDYQ